MDHRTGRGMRVRSNYCTEMKANEPLIKWQCRCSGQVMLSFNGPDDRDLFQLLVDLENEP